MGLTIFFGTLNMTPESPEITVLLKAWGSGDAAALDQLTPLVYDELRRLARRYMRTSAPGTRCRPLRWSMKRTCGWWMQTAWPGRIGCISSRSRPK